MPINKRTSHVLALHLLDADLGDVKPRVVTQEFVRTEPEKPNDGEGYADCSTQGGIIDAKNLPGAFTSQPFIHQRHRLTALQQWCRYCRTFHYFPEVVLAADLLTFHSFHHLELLGLGELDLISWQSPQRLRAQCRLQCRCETQGCDGCTH